MPTLPPPARLLPQTPPMILIDEVLEWAPPKVACRVSLRPDSMFVEDGKVPGLVAVEYMAQTIGAFVGLVRTSRGEPIRVGFLLGTRELKLGVDQFDVGDELTVEAEHIFGESFLGSFRCRVARGGDEVASAVINCFQSPDEEVPNP